MKRCREKTMSFLYLKSWTTGLDHGSQVYPEMHSGPGALHSQRNHWIHRWVSWCRVLCFRRVVHIHKYRIYKRKVIWNWNWVVHYHLSLPHIKQECGFILLDAQLPLIFQITLRARERLLLPHYLWLSIIICPNRPQSIWTVIPRLRFCFYIECRCGIVALTVSRHHVLSECCCFFSCVCEMLKLVQKRAVYFELLWLTAWTVTVTYFDTQKSEWLKWRGKTLKNICYVLSTHFRSFPL